MYTPFKLEREYIDRFSTIGIDPEPLMDGEYSHDDIIEYLDWEEREQEPQLTEYAAPIVEEAPPLEVPQVVTQPEPSIPTVAPQQPTSNDNFLDSNVGFRDSYNLMLSSLNEVMSYGGFFVEKVGELTENQNIQRFGQDIKAGRDHAKGYYMDQVSVKAKEDLAKELFKVVGRNEWGFPTDIEAGDANLGKIMGLASQAAGSSIIPMTGGWTLTKGLASSLLKNYPKLAAGIGYGSGAAAVEGVGTARDVHDTILGADDNMVSNTHIYRAIEDKILSENPNASRSDLLPFVKASIANQTAFDTGVISGAITGVTTIPFGVLLGKLGLGTQGVTRESLINSVFKGMTYEGSQEFVEGFSQKILHNYGQWVSGQEIKPLTGALTSGAEGAIGGATIGGGFAGAANLLQPKVVEPTQDIVPDIVQDIVPETIVPETIVPEDTTIVDTVPEILVEEDTIQVEPTEVEPTEVVETVEDVADEEPTRYSDVEDIHVGDVARWTGTSKVDYVPINRIETAEDGKQFVVFEESEEGFPIEEIQLAKDDFLYNDPKELKRQKGAYEALDFLASRDTAPVGKESAAEILGEDVAPVEDVADEVKKPQFVGDKVQIGDPPGFTKAGLDNLFPSSFEEQNVGDKAKLEKEKDRYLKARVNNKSAILKKIENLYTKIKPKETTETQAWKSTNDQAKKELLVKKAKAKKEASEAKEEVKKAEAKVKKKDKEARVAKAQANKIAKQKSKDDKAKKKKEVANEKAKVKAKALDDAKKVAEKAKKKVKVTKDKEAKVNEEYEALEKTTKGRKAIASTRIETQPINTIEAEPVTVLGIDKKDGEYIAFLKVPSGERKFKFYKKKDADEFVSEIKNNTNGLASTSDEVRRARAKQIRGGKQLTKPQQEASIAKKNREATAKAGMQIAFTKILSNPRNKAEEEFIVRVIASTEKDQDYIMRARDMIDQNKKELSLLVASGKRGKKTNVAMQSLKNEIQKNEIAIDNWKKKITVLGGKYKSKDAIDITELDRESEFILKQYGNAKTLANEFANDMKGLMTMTTEVSKLKIPSEYVWDSSGYFRKGGKTLTKDEQDNLRLMLAKKIIDKEKRILKKILDHNIKSILGYDDALSSGNKAYKALQEAHDSYAKAVENKATKNILDALAKNIVEAENHLMNAANILVSFKMHSNNEVASLDLSKNKLAYNWLNKYYWGDPDFVLQDKDLTLVKLKEKAKEFKISTTDKDTRKSIANKIGDKATKATDNGHTFGIAFIDTNNLKDAQKKYATRTKSIIDSFNRAKTTAQDTKLGSVGTTANDEKALKKLAIKSAEYNVVTTVKKFIDEVRSGEFFNGVNPEEVLGSIDYTTLIKDKDLAKKLNEYKKSSSRLTMAKEAPPEKILRTPTASSTIEEEEGVAQGQEFSEQVEGQDKPIPLEIEVQTKKEIEEVEEKLSAIDKDYNKIKIQLADIDSRLNDIKGNEELKKEYAELLSKKSNLVKKTQKKYRESEAKASKELEKLENTLTRIGKQLAPPKGKRASKKADAREEARREKLFKEDKVVAEQAKRIANDYERYQQILGDLKLVEKPELDIRSNFSAEYQSSIPSDKKIDALWAENREARKNAPPPVKSRRIKKGIRIAIPTDKVSKATLKRLRSMDSDGSVKLEFNHLNYNHSLSNSGVNNIYIYKNVGGKIGELPIADVTIDNGKVKIDYFRSHITSSQSSEAMKKIESKEAVSIADAQAAVDIAISDIRSIKGKKKSVGIQRIDRDRLELVLTSRPTREGYDQPFFSDKEAEQYERNVDGIDVTIESNVDGKVLTNKEKKDRDKRFKTTDEGFKSKQIKSAEDIATVNNLEKKIEVAEDKLKKTKEKSKIIKLKKEIFDLDNSLRTIRNSMFNQGAGLSPFSKFIRRNMPTDKDVNTLKLMQGNPKYSDTESLGKDDTIMAKEKIIKLREDNKLECP